MPVVREVEIDELELDPQNANLGTPEGRRMLSGSLKKHRAGRSILIDRDGRVIAGNKTLEEARALGYKRVIVVQTDGGELVAVQRTDLDLDGEDGSARQLAYADNRVGQVDLVFDPEQIILDVDAGIDLSDLWEDWEIEEFRLEVEGANNEPPADPWPQIDRAG